MIPELNFALLGGHQLAEEVRLRGFDRFLALAEHVRQLRYGRLTRASHLLAVLDEGQGTCSAKHRLLAAVAQECGHPEVELMVGVYEMSEQNTPGVGGVLAAAGFVSVPEAHCYLRIGDRRYDFTGLSSGTNSPFDALLSEHTVLPAHLPDVKANLHQSAVLDWSQSHGLSFEDAWALRETCIQALAANAPLRPGKVPARR